MSLRIGLLGAAPTSVRLAPFGDPNWEIWACSPSNYSSPRVDCWFEIHSLDRKEVRGNEPYITALQNHPRVYLSRADSRLPYGLIWPRKEVYEFFGEKWQGPDFPYMLDSFIQSSVSFMFALAIMQKPQSIGMWGIDMAAHDEYAFQRPGCHFFIREAELRGIEVIAPPQSDILEPLPLYGYKEHMPKYWRTRAREEELKNRMAAAEKHMKQASEEFKLCNGAVQELQYEKNTYMRGRYE